MEPRGNRARARSTTRRFNGVEKTSRQWDCLRKDHELWYEDADCLVHFYAEGSSQRGPSLKIPFVTVQLSTCSYLLENCLSARKVSSASKFSDSGYESNSSPSPQPKTFELYIPAPAGFSREQAYSYHVTTRNYFALLTNQALVGDKLGVALVELWERTTEWHPDGDAKATLLGYCQQQGYLAVSENVQYATAMLYFSEKALVKELWNNSFVHCVGMHDRLDLSADFYELSNITKALVTRASLEMDLHLSRVIRAFGCFLEEELGADRLGLSKSARNHLDRFRGFLQSHYLDRLGYFPPSSSDPYTKQLWQDLHDDFESLYELLADTTSDGSMINDSNASGGLCCLQNTQAFDQRHGCESLPHPSPLLPAVEPTRPSTETQRTLRSLRLGRSTSVSQPKLTPRRALAEAVNKGADESPARPIVQEYQRFERSRLEEKITVHEARKVRWLLIYATLQILKSITRVPVGVKDATTASYPLCVLTTGCPEWLEDETEEGATGATTPLSEGTGPGMPVTPDVERERPDSEGRISIHPDCEADNAAEYFSNSRRSSINALDLTPPPLRITRPTRTASIRTSVSSGVNVLQRQFSIARRNSSRKSVNRPQHRRNHSYEIVAQGYTNDTEKKETSREEALDELEGGMVQAPVQELVQASTGTTHNPWQEFDFGLQNLAEEPTLNDRHLVSAFGLDLLPPTKAPESYPDHVPELERLEEVDEDTPGNRNSWIIGEAAFTARRPAFDYPISATTYSSNADSLRSSYMADECDTPVTVYSSPSESPTSSRHVSVSFEKPHLAMQMQQHAQPRHVSSLMEIASDCSTASAPSLSTGCYVPSGLPGNGSIRSSVAPARSKFSRYHSHESSGTDVQSAASSIYELDGRPVYDLEAESVRGRGRTRVSDHLTVSSQD